MISVDEAKKIIEDVIPRGNAVKSPLDESIFRVIANDVIAPHDFPLFGSSAMDGFALYHEETKAASQERPLTLRVVDHVFAGDVSSKPIRFGEAAKIMTGAPLPRGATAVVALEDVLQSSSDEVTLFFPVQEGKNIRRQGEEIKKGERAIEAFQVITPAMIGFLASLGVSQAPIFQAPKISILPTGNELMRNVESPVPSKIFESNSHALMAALKYMGLCGTLFPPATDDKEHLRRALQECFQKSDIIIISGGVSVGEKDYVREVFTEMRGETLFWKVAQKPGKPIFFGRMGNRFVFGLPGNPASALVCFYEYVKPACLLWLGVSSAGPVAEKALCTVSFSKKEGLTYFLRAVAKRDGGSLWATPLSSQESHRLQSFALANCLIVVPSATQELQKGDTIDIHWIDERRNA